MPDYRVIGFYRDNLQIYDGDASGEDFESAVCGLRDSMVDAESKSLMLVAVLDADGDNLLAWSDKCVLLAEFEEAVL